MESFQQSGLNISLHRWRNGGVHGHGSVAMVSTKDSSDHGTSATDFTRARAMTKDIEPLRSSLSITADAGEYASEGGVETRE